METKAVGLMRRHWQGGYGLGRSFWVHYIASHIALQWLVRSLDAEMPLRIRALIALGSFLLLVLLYLWAGRGVWMAARSRRRAGRFFATLAQATVSVHGLCLCAAGTAGAEAFGEMFAILGGEPISEPFTLQVSEDGKTLALEGGINEGLADALRAALEIAPHVQTLTLSSNGGLMEEADKVQGIVTEHALDTRVDGACISACTSIFLAGKERLLGSAGALGFHRARMVGAIARTTTFERAATAAFYANRELPEWFVSRVLATPPEEVWQPKASELLEARVATRVGNWREGYDGMLESLHKHAVARGGQRSPLAAYLLARCIASRRIDILEASACPHQTPVDAHWQYTVACLRARGLAEQFDGVEYACDAAL